MRWTLTSPDGLGDFLLRLPWLRLMEQSGWELQLLARQPTIELAQLVGLQANFVSLRLSPYSKEARRRLSPFRCELKAMRAFLPDQVFLGPSQPTFLEEQIRARWSRCPVGGFVVTNGFWSSEGLRDPDDLAGDYNFTVEVEADFPEHKRNQRAASKLLGVELPGELEPYAFSASDVEQLPRREDLPSNYFVVCAGYRQGDYFQGWGCDSWALALRQLEREVGARFVFTGSPAEAYSHAEILEKLECPPRHFDLTGKVQSIAELCGILAGSQAYIGKDSGSMHLAAALRRPVLALFGGGHKERFYPHGTKAVTMTVGVPCRGCDWRCHLDAPLCVRDLPPWKLLAGWHKLSELSDGEVWHSMERPSLEAEQVLAKKKDPDYPRRVHKTKRHHALAERNRILFWAKPFRRI